MTSPTQLPDFVTHITSGTSFSFGCHQGVKCFTECCRLLELALTPYDVLRLRRGTGCSSSELLDNYILTEQDPGEPFPRFYLTMVDDGRASCAFVSDAGCKVYGHRPAACRTYPLGRAISTVSEDEKGIKEHYVLIKEPHCKGFGEPDIQNISSYSSSQNLSDYNRYNDAVASILQHDAIRKGFVPSKKQADLFTLALYNIDTFRGLIFADKVGSIQLTTEQKENLKNDEQLLLFSIDWLQKELFSPFC